jgi:hypothetical protein
MATTAQGDRATADCPDHRSLVGMAALAWAEHGTIDLYLDCAIIRLGHVGIVQRRAR